MKFFGVLFLVVALVAAVFVKYSSAEVDKICRQPISSGYGEDLNMWGYDTDRGECRRFVYHGCGGTTNRFYSLADCQDTCREQ